MTTFAELWASRNEALTPLEKWTHTARAMVFLEWHANHPGEYLSHEVAEQVVEEAARTRPMPTYTLADVLAASWTPEERARWRTNP